MHLLDLWREVLERRWTAGCRNGARRWQGLRDAGFKGGMRVVTEWASRQQLAALGQQPGPAAASAVRPPTPPAAYPARQVAWMLAADLAVLAEPDRGYVERLLALAKVRDLAQRFGAMARDRCADALTPWLAEAEKGDLREDEQAVRAALTLPWSSGQVEGQVTRLKLIKRRGYDRAGLDLLRVRLIRAA